MGLSEEIEKLQRLHQAGALSDEEYAKAKAALFDGPPIAAGGQVNPADPAALAQQVNQWAMFLHLSLLAGFVVPFAGLVLPIVLWQVKKTEMPELDVHGKIVVNWLISAFIYSMVCFLLIFVIIGIPLFIAIMIVGVVFPIMGAIKASNGVVWKYPLSIPFFK